MEQPVGLVDGEAQIATETQNATLHCHLKKVLSSARDLHAALGVDNVGQQVQDTLSGQDADIDRPDEVIMVFSRRLRGHTNRPRRARLKFHRFEATTQPTPPSWGVLPQLYLPVAR